LKGFFWVDQKWVASQSLFAGPQRKLSLFLLMSGTERKADMTTARPVREHGAGSKKPSSSSLSPKAGTTVHAPEQGYAPRVSDGFDVD
jgi:hypothetical protein